MWLVLYAFDEASWRNNQYVPHVRKKFIAACASLNQEGVKKPQPCSVSRQSNAVKYGLKLSARRKTVGKTLRSSQNAKGNVLMSNASE